MSLLEKSENGTKRPSDSYPTSYQNMDSIMKSSAKKEIHFTCPSVKGQLPITCPHKYFLIDGTLLT